MEEHNNVPHCRILEYIYIYIFSLKPCSKFHCFRSIFHFGWVRESLGISNEMTYNMQVSQNTIEKASRQKRHISTFADCWYLKNMSWAECDWNLFESSSSGIVVVSGHDWDGKGSTSLAGWIGSSFPKKGSPMIWQVDEGIQFLLHHSLIS